MLGTYMHPPIGGRVPTKQVDATCRTGYSLIGVKPKTPAEMVTEYYVVRDSRIFEGFRPLILSPLCLVCAYSRDEVDITAFMT
jgi:hypothetical protein